MLPNTNPKYKPTGNPNWVKGHVANPNGRPKGPVKYSLNVRRRLTGKWKTHPIDKLVTIANFMQATNPEFAGKIWMRILDSWETEERKTKGSMSPVPITETALNDDDLKLLEDFNQQHDSNSITDSKDRSVETGEAKVPLEASPEEDLRSNPE